MSATQQQPRSSISRALTLLAGAAFCATAAFALPAAGKLIPLTPDGTCGGDPNALVKFVAPAGKGLADRIGAICRRAGVAVQVCSDGRHLTAELPLRLARTLPPGGSAGVIPAGLSAPIIQALAGDCNGVPVAQAGVPSTGKTTFASPTARYAFTPATSGVFALSLEGSNFDTTLTVYRGCGGNRVAFDDDGGTGLTSKLILTLTAGSPYVLEISGAFGFTGIATGNYRLLITAYVPAPGEICETALPAQLDTVYEGAITDSHPHAWYAFTPTETSVYVLSLRGSDFATELSVCRGCAGEDDRVALGYSEWSSETTELALYLTAGTTYRIGINGYLDDVGAYKLVITNPAFGPGQSCRTALPAQLDSVYQGITSRSYPSVWYTFAPPASGVFVVSLQGSAFDTYLEVYDRCDGFVIASNDDSGGQTSRLSVTLSSGTTYLIRISGYRGAVGKYKLQITTAAVPPNDTIATALPVQIGKAYQGATDGATSTLAESLAALADSRDVWHTFTPAAEGFYRIRAVGTDFDPTLGVYEAIGGRELSSCDDANDCTLSSAVCMSLAAGTPYLLRVAGVVNQTGHYTLTVDPVVQALPTAPKAPNPPDRAQGLATGIVLSWDGWQPPAQPAAGSPGSISLASIYGHDGRLDEYQIHDPNVLGVGNATAVLLNASALAQDQGQYRLLDTTRLADQFEFLCPDEPFRDQPAPGWCSAFLVAPDVIATAGHCPDCAGEMAKTAVVFGFVMKDAQTAVTSLPAANVYFCREVVAAQNGAPDWALVRLDRPVTGRVPVRLRRTGLVPEGEPLLVIGHPWGLPRKYDSGAMVMQNWSVPYFEANADVFGGNSGSAVFAQKTRIVEGIAVTGLPDWVTNPTTGCTCSMVYPNEQGYPNPVIPPWGQATRVTAFSGLVPSYDVYLGPDPQRLTLVDSGGAAPQYGPAGLQRGQTYYWQIVARNSSGKTPGPVWSFTLAP